MQALTLRSKQTLWRQYLTSLIAQASLSAHIWNNWWSLFDKYSQNFAKKAIDIPKVIPSLSIIKFMTLLIITIQPHAVKYDYFLHLYKNCHKMGQFHYFNPQVITTIISIWAERVTWIFLKSFSHNFYKN